MVRGIVAAQGPDWKPFEFLLGKWTGVAADKDSQLGPGEGGCSFELNLNKNIIVRKNVAKDTSGVSHDDFLVIYAEGAPAPSTSTPKAT